MLAPKYIWIIWLSGWLVLRQFWPFPQLLWWQTTGLLHGALMLGAFLVIGGKLRHLIVPDDALYADGTGGWHWRRAWLAIPILMVMWGVSLALASMIGSVSLTGLGPSFVLTVLLVQVAFVGLGQELFFREAAIRAAAGDGFRLIFLAVFLSGAIHWQNGGDAMMLGMGAGAVFLAARLAGVPILVVAAMNGLSTTLIGYVIWHDAYAQSVIFMFANFIIAAGIIGLAGVHRRRRLISR